jgi:two-component system phosphate regulon sensor histidine kinase PhoR
LRRCIQDLAEQNAQPLEGETAHIVNKAVDAWIAKAVETYVRERALQLQRERDEHLAFLLHDLKNPLSNISLSAGVIEQSFRLDPDATQRALRLLRRNLGRLDELLTHTLEREKALAGATRRNLLKEPLQLLSVADAVLADLRPLAEATGSRLLSEVPHDLYAHVDRRAFERILENLVSNAIRFTPDGLVEVGARARDDGSIECWVRDEGQGIPQERLAAVFDKFETDPGRPSTGFGLAIVKQLVEAHGGNVSVESHLGQGTTFRFLIPTQEHAQG